MIPNETLELRTVADEATTRDLLRRCAHTLSKLGPHNDPETAELWVGRSAAANRRIVGLEDVTTVSKEVNGEVRAIADGYRIPTPTDEHPVAVTFLSGSSDAQLSIASAPTSDGQFAIAITYRLPNRQVRSNYEDTFMSLLDAAEQCGVPCVEDARYRLSNVVHERKVVSG